MLQQTNSPPMLEGDRIPTDAYPAAHSFGHQFDSIIAFIRRQFLVVLLALPLTIGIAALYLYVAPPVYSSQALVFVEPIKIQVFKTSILADDPISTPMLDSQIEILKSDGFASSLVKQLHLAQDPEFVGDGFVSRAKNLFANLIGLKADRAKSETELLERALYSFKKRLTVSRVPSTYVIDIGFKSSNPNRAAEVANAVADKYIAEQLQAKYENIQKATIWLQDRLSELRSQASVADKAVIEYKMKSNIVDTGDQSGRGIDEQRLSELNTAIVKARADTAEAQARVQRLVQILDNENLDPSSAAVGTVTEALHSEVITKLRQRYLELAQRESTWATRYGSSHLAVANVRDEMSEIRHSIVDELKRIAAAAQSDYDIARAREASLEKSLGATVEGSQTTNKARIELRQLETTALAYRSLYENFQQRYADALQQQSSPMSEAHLISKATPSLEKSAPKTGLVLAGGIASGLLLGFGLAFLREISDRVFRTSSQVADRLGAECVALVPMIKLRREAASADSSYPPHAKVLAPRSGLLQHAINSPLSRFSEEIRGLKVRIDVADALKPNKIVGITSSLPNEGKSTISASLAQLSAYGGARVVLVDCDLRKRSLSRELAPDATMGIIEVIGGESTVDEAIWSDPQTRLAFLPLVVKTRLTHASEVLASKAMRQLFSELREKYDYVIVDLPPLAPVVDVRAAIHLFDCFLFVVEWGKTKIDVADHALATNRGVFDNLLGVILNKVDSNRHRYYDFSRKQYYHNEYYAQYHTD